MAELPELDEQVLADWLVQQRWFLAVQAFPVVAWLSLLLARKRNESLANNPKLRRQDPARS